jgi:hypothetical protein
MTYFFHSLDGACHQPWPCRYVKNVDDLLKNGPSFSFDDRPPLSVLPLNDFV